MNFKDVAHKTVAELFDMLKAKVAAIQEMDEVIKLQDADLRKYEKQIEGLKEQLNNMEACYIEKKKQVEDQQKRIDEALTWLTRTDIRPINCAREILRGRS
ncbi:hypothetical protein [Acinetobacter variabilis]|uniref:Uncharacterized protein n=1 Tax=Acinetobacter variabilis TaxID=70346 RepID=N9P407_9GAMM|nr:hypothetical protein [Acinetobacter variabilis]ENX08860.1 hypothetical protein F897_02011 [Acinetobacter variabilis]UBI31010.1 hypothetical protein LA331_02220 [Acinetobacter variabilis]